MDEIMGKEITDEQKDRIDMRLDPSRAISYNRAFRDLSPEGQIWADFIRDMIDLGIKTAYEKNQDAFARATLNSKILEEKLIEVLGKMSPEHLLGKKGPKQKGR